MKEASHPLTAGLFSSSPPRIAARQMVSWLDSHGYSEDIDQNIALHTALTSILTGSPVFGLRLPLRGGTRDSDIDVFAFRMADIMKQSVLKMTLDHALSLCAVTAEEGDTPEFVGALQDRYSAFQAYTMSRQAKENSYFYGFVTYERPQASLLVGAEPIAPSTIEVVMSAMAFKQPKNPLTSAEVDELGVDAASTEMNRRGGKMFRFPPPNPLMGALAEYVLRAQTDTEMEQEAAEVTTGSGLILPGGGSGPGRLVLSGGRL